MKTIEFFVKKDTTEADLEYIAIRDNAIICRIKREKEFDNFWVIRDIEGMYLYRDQYRNDIFEWIEAKFK
jgi:hypothetical protein